MSYIVLVSNYSAKVAAFGTATGRPFRSERAAEQAAKRHQEVHPNLTHLVLDLDPAGVTNMVQVSSGVPA